MENTGDLDPEILDSLYKHQLKELRELTLKLEDTQDINLCRTWLQVFNKTAEDEKISRNCLCALLCQQLKNYGCLSTPFTELSNCNRNLTQVLANLDETASTESRSIYIQLSRRTASRESILNCSSQENEILQLRQELKHLRQNRDEKEAKIRELTTIIDRCNQCQMESDVMKKISNLLEYLKKENDIEKFWIFSHLFADADNTDMNHKLTDLDRSLQSILQNNAAGKLLAAKRQFNQIIKSREKLLRKYQQQLRIERWQRKMKVKMIKLQFCSILSRIFIQSRQKSQVQLLDLFNQLEDKYKNILSKLTAQQ